MSGIATAIAVGAAVGGGTAYMNSKAQDQARKDAKEAQAATDKKDALFNLMSVVGGQGANPMGNTQPLPAKGNGLLGVGVGALQGALPGISLGANQYARKAEAADKAAYMKALTDYTNNLNQASFARGADGAITGFNPKPQSLSPMELMMMSMMGAGGGGVGGISPAPVFGGVPASSR